MSNPLVIRNEIRIDAPAAEVWDALVNPEQTPKYMFGCRAISDFKAGSPLRWNADLEGKETTFVTGHIVSIDPEKRLVYTTFDPLGQYADIPENYLTVTYTLEAEADQTRLIVTQGDYAKAAKGRERYDEAMAEGGWSSILEQIKELLEQSGPKPV